MRIIDADALRKCFEVPHELKCGIQAGMDEYALKCIDEQPTIEAVPVVHGYWVTETVRGDYVPCCSECGLENGTLYEYDYCPHCGTRMDGERREGKEGKDNG